MRGMAASRPFPSTTTLSPLLSRTPPLTPSFAFPSLLSLVQTGGGADRALVTDAPLPTNSAVPCRRAATCSLPNATQPGRRRDTPGRCPGALDLCGRYPAARMIDVGEGAGGRGRCHPHSVHYVFGHFILPGRPQTQGFDDRTMINNCIAFSIVNLMYLI